jgi:glycosyltransferase involved in cell wall biosynthesis
MSTRELVFNGRQLSSSFSGGVVRYARELSQHLDVSRVLVPPNRMASGPLGHLWDQTVAPVQSRDAVLFSPANFGPLVHPRHVITIHDLSPIEHPEWFSAGYSRVFAQLVPSLARKATHVVTDSTFSKERLVEVTGVGDAKITVAGAGLSAAFREVEPSSGNGDVVVIGGRDPRKNVARVLEAWRLIEGSLPEHRLVVVGGARSGWVFGDSQPSDDDQLVNDLSDEQLAELMGEASLVVFCPFYEGFGLPALESMAVGTPLVASEIAPLVELAGDAAWFADPHSARSIADAMEAALSDEAEASRRVSLGQKLSINHTWEAVARNVQVVLEDVS